MQYIDYIIAVFCAFGTAAGQLLFKKVGLLWRESEGSCSMKALQYLFLSGALYAVISISWVWLLRRIDINRIYPIMALSFIFVPIGNNFIFQEKISAQYFIGVIIVMAGVVVTIKS